MARASFSMSRFRPLFVRFASIVARATMSGIIVFDYVARWPHAVTELAAWLAAGSLHSDEHIETGIDTFPQALVALFAGKNRGKQLVQVKA